MIFTSPSWVPPMADPPDSIPICEFMLDEQYGRHPICDAKPPFTCGLTGVEYSVSEVKDRVDWLARALSNKLDWNPNRGSEWDKVAGIFSVNTVCASSKYRADLNHVADRCGHRLTPSHFPGP